MSALPFRFIYFSARAARHRGRIVISEATAAGLVDAMSEDALGRLLVCYELAGVICGTMNSHPRRRSAGRAELHVVPPWRADRTGRCRSYRHPDPRFEPAKIV